MGLKNELLDKKERLQTAVNANDVETVNEIVTEWMIEGWTHREIAERFEEWCDMDLATFDALMDDCDEVSRCH